MLFQQTYAKNSGVRHHNGKTTVDFAPDLSREPTFFRGKIADPLRYRDAMIALRDVVVSDLNYKPKDHSAYQAWVQEQYLIDIADALERRSELGKRMKELQARLKEINKEREKYLEDYYKAQRRYFRWLYEVDRQGWFVLDPVITVAPDQVFFEAFSLDESSYGRLAVHEELFQDVTDFQYGTTNIDFSDSLLNELKRMRTYRPTEFQVDPSGFEVATEGREVYKEKKIDVPTSWIRGFLQVQSAMSLPTYSFDMRPIDLYNICSFLRKHRERKSPRSLKYILTPGQPVKVVIEPWNEELVLDHSIYLGETEQVIRTWGRRRLFLLERLLPLAKNIQVHLLGTGLPSFYLVDLGSLSFTLGLSGWTRNDWASAGQFDLLTGGTDQVTSLESTTLFSQLKLKKTMSDAELSAATRLPLGKVHAALKQLCSAGRVMFDLEIGKYRLRELTRDPISMEELQYTNPREEKAEQLLADEALLYFEQDTFDEKQILTGKLKGEKRPFEVRVELDQDARLEKATCNCYFYRTNRLMQGPCEHILAVMIQARRQNN